MVWSCWKFNEFAFLNLFFNILLYIYWTFHSLIFSISISFLLLLSFCLSFLIFVLSFSFHFTFIVIFFYSVFIFLHYCVSFFLSLSSIRLLLFLFFYLFQFCFSFFCFSPFLCISVHFFLPLSLCFVHFVCWFHFLHCLYYFDIYFTLFIHSFIHSPSFSLFLSYQNNTEDILLMRPWLHWKYWMLQLRAFKGWDYIQDGVSSMMNRRNKMERRPGFLHTFYTTKISRLIALLKQLLLFNFVQPFVSCTQGQGQIILPLVIKLTTIIIIINIIIIIINVVILKSVVKY